MISTYEIDGLLIETGDIICTTETEGNILPGEFWRLLGRLVPGEVDHIAIYVGPAGRCVEAGGRGVITFEIADSSWAPSKMIKHRGRFLDRLYGVAYPLVGRGFSQKEETRIRISVAEYCLRQAAAEKPYNINFLDADTEDGFYCSQLAYKAYLPHGIDLNTGLGVPNLPGTSGIVFPQEIWEGCWNRRAGAMVVQRDV